MRFRMGVITGFAAGYVLGARAGRERYEQLARAARTAWGSEPAERFREEAGKAMGGVGHKAAEAARAVAHHGGGDGHVAAGADPMAAGTIGT